MPNVKELATVTSKGQLTLPKAVRQALGVDAGTELLIWLLPSRARDRIGGPVARGDAALACCCDDGSD